MDGENKGTVKLIVWSVGIVVGIALLLALNPMMVISAGERGVVMKFGKVQEQVFNEGLHFVNPIGTDVEIMDVRVQKEEIQASAASKDIQAISAKIAVTYKLDENKLLDIFRNVRQDYSDRYISPNIQEAVKAATAKYTAEELVTKREAVRDEIKNNFEEKIAGTGILVEGIAIVDFDFSSQFNAAIEAKVTAEQRAKEAENKLRQVEAEAKQSIEKAKAEAESIRLQSDAANNPRFVELKKLEVQLEFAKKWNGVLPINIYGSAPIPFLDVNAK